MGWLALVGIFMLLTALPTVGFRLYDAWKYRPQDPEPQKPIPPESRLGKASIGANVTGIDGWLGLISTKSDIKTSKKKTTQEGYKEAQEE